MSNEYNRSKSCKNKFAFSTRSTAVKVAKKFNQNTYCCPVCFCWHNTSCDKWQDEYVHIDKYNNLKSELEKTLLISSPERIQKIKAKYARTIVRQMEKLAEYRDKIKQLNKIINS